VRTLERSQSVVENAEFELQPRQARRKDQHALQRADRGFYVTNLNGKRSIFEGGVEVVRLLQHRLEQGFAARLDLLDAGAADLGRHHALRRHGRFGLRKSVAGRNPGKGERQDANGVKHAFPARYKPLRQGVTAVHRASQFS
jgi:hypothetical protein